MVLQGKILRTLLSLLAGGVLLVIISSATVRDDMDMVVCDCVGATSEYVTVAGVGDIMLGTSFPSNAYLPDESILGTLFGTLGDTLNTFDVVFGNLEGAFLNDGPPAKICRDSTLCYLFRMPERYAVLLRDAGFNMISLANNHINDFGDAGRRRSMRLLDSLGIAHAGVTERPYDIVEVRGLKVGLVAFAPNRGTVNMHDHDGVASLIATMKERCNIVVASFHGGAEGADYQHLTREVEYYHGENRGNVYEFARLLIDSGADIVFGHGPHVARAIDLYKDRFIAYSLGNFMTFSRFNIQGPNGLAPVAVVTVNSEGEFVTGRIVPGHQLWRQGVRYDGQRRVINRIRELNLADIPESPIALSEEGLIYRKE